MRQYAPAPTRPPGRSLSRTTATGEGPSLSQASMGHARYHFGGISVSAPPALGRLPGEPATDSAQAEAPAPTAENTPAAPADPQNALAQRIRTEYSRGILVCFKLPQAYESAQDAIDLGPSRMDSYGWNVNWADFYAAHQQACDAQGITASWRGATTAQKRAMRGLMWADPAWRQRVAQSAYTNNLEVERQANRFAGEYHAVGLNPAGELTMAEEGRGKATVYNGAQDLVSKAQEINHQVHDLLVAHPPRIRILDPELEAAQAERGARIRFLTLSAHGDRRWLGGHGHADGGSITADNIDDIAAGIGPIVADDVRIRLFACSSAKGDGSDATRPEEGSTADLLRDAFTQVHEDGTAYASRASATGHFEPGNTVRNWTVRFLGPDGSAWGVTDIFPTEFVDSELVRLGIQTEGQQTPRARQTKMRQILGNFISRDAWIRYDMSSLESFREDCQSAWQEAYPGDPADPAHSDGHDLLQAALRG